MDDAITLLDEDRQMSHHRVLFSQSLQSLAESRRVSQSLAVFITMWG